MISLWRYGRPDKSVCSRCCRPAASPFADELLQSLQSQQEQLENGEVPEGLSPQLQQQVQQGANMQAVQQGYNALTGQGQQQQQ